MSYRRLSSIAAPVLLALTATVALAQTASERQAAAAAGTSERVKAAQQQMLEAAIKGDKDAVSEFLLDNVTFVANGGKVLDKQAVLAMLPAPVHNLSDQQVRQMGDVAVVTGMAHMNNGQDVRFLQEWVNRDGQWKLMAHEGAPMPSASGAASTTETTGTTGTDEAVVEARRSVAPTLNSNDERSVWQAQEALRTAFEKGDAGTYGKYTSDDYVRINADGAMYGKRDFLQTVKEYSRKSPGRIEASDVQIEVKGNMARVVWKSWGTLPGGDLAGVTRATRIFEKKNGRWQQVAVVFTPIAGGE